MEFSESIRKLGKWSNENMDEHFATLTKTQRLTVSKGLRQVLALIEKTPKFVLFLFTLIQT